MMNIVREKREKIPPKIFLKNLQRIKRHLDLKQSTYLHDSYEEITVGYPLEKIR
jgi:hypothetical protein